MQPTDPSQENPAAYGQPQQPPPGYGQPHAGQPHADPAQGYPPPGPGYGPPAGYVQPAPKKPLLPLSIGDALTALGGLLVFAFSFAPFVSYDSTDLTEELEKRGLSSWFGAWSTETFMAPLTWFVALAGLAAVGFALLRLTVPRDRELLGFRIGHLQVGLALFAFVVMFGYATASKSAIFGHDVRLLFDSADGSSAFDMSLSWGGYVMLVGALIAAVGAILSQLGVGPVVFPVQPRAPMAHPQQYGAPQQYPPNNVNAPTAAYPTVDPSRAQQYAQYQQAEPSAQYHQQDQSAHYQQPAQPVQPVQSAPPAQQAEQAAPPQAQQADQSGQWPGQQPPQPQ